MPRIIPRLTLLALVACAPLLRAVEEEAFLGPMPHWIDVHAAPYNAVGDGTADDTAALQHALDDCAAPSKPLHVYLRAGTYRVTATLNARGKRGLHVIGDDPATTRIRYAGAAGGTLLRLQGCADGYLGRFTLDGAGTAAVALDHDNTETGSDLYGGNWVFSDLVFRDATRGFVTGRSDKAVAESRVLRCRFLNCSDSGFSTRNYNVLNWWLWYCAFEDCGTAVHEYQGGLHVTRCVFKRSTVADIYMQNSANAGIRENWSIDSRRFYVAGNFQGDALQGNVVLYTVEADAVVTNGVTAFLDNTIRSRAGVTAPAVRIGANDLLAIGNTFTVATPYQNASSRMIELDRRVVDRTAISSTEPTLPPTPPRVSRTIFTVTAPGTGADIQRAIDRAAASSDPRPVVYIRAGEYPTTVSIVVPADRALEILGEGRWGITTITASSPIHQPILRLAGPTRATLGDIHVRAHPQEDQSEAILVENADQAGGRVFIQHVTCNDFNDLVSNPIVHLDRLDRTVVEARGFNAHSIRVTGGPLAAAGTPGTARTRLLGTNSSIFGVADGATLHVTNLYTEIAAQPALPLTGSGRFALDGAMYKRTAKPTAPGIAIAGFAGTVAILGTLLIDNPIAITGDGSRTTFLGQVDIQTYTGYTGSVYSDSSAPAAKAALVDSFDRRTSSWVTLPNPSSIDAAMIRSAADLARNDRPLDDPLAAVADGATDLRCYRLYLSYGKRGLPIAAAANPDTTPPATPAAPTVSSTTSATPTVSGTTEANTTVRIRDNGTLIGTATANASGAWSWTVSPALAAGTHALTVTATDAAGNTSGTSAATTVTVAATDPPPTVALTAPLGSAVFTAPATYALTATASDADGIAKVEFLRDGIVLGQDTTAPYAFTWSGVAAGTYTLRARATDSRGASATSAAVTITVRVRIDFQPASAPTVSGWSVDGGAAFTTTRGYGWSRDISDTARDRNALSDQLRDTLVQSQRSSPAATWKLALPDGIYDVTLGVGDPSYTDSVYRWTLEGQTVVDFTPSSSVRSTTVTRTVTVGDGFLDLGNGSGAVNNKIQFIEVRPAAAPSSNG